MLSMKFLPLPNEPLAVSQEIIHDAFLCSAQNEGNM
jgi:hypothetical protein